MKKAVFDLEANGLHEATKIWCIVIKDLDDSRVYKYGPDSISDGVDHLASYELLIGHNIIDYDSYVIDNLTSVKLTGLWDTLVASRLLHPDRKVPEGFTGRSGPHSLDAWGYRLGLRKPVHEDWTKFSEEMLHRCAMDVEINHRLYTQLNLEMKGHDWNSALSMEFSVQEIISRQTRTGVLLDKKSAENAVQELTGWIEKLDIDLEKYAPTKTKPWGVTIDTPFKKNGEMKKAVLDWTDQDVQGPFNRVLFERINLSSDVQLKELLFTLGWKPKAYNFSVKTGERTSPKLEFYEGDGLDSGLGKMIKDRKLWSHRRSQIQGWLDKLRPDDRLPAGANTIGTPTRRFRHNVVVNVPKAGYNKSGEELAFYGNKMRSLFTVPKGYKLVGYDAEQLELRMLAHYMNDPAYTQEILSGDIHSYNQELAGLPTRDDAKTFIYAFNYGAGDAKIGSIVGGSVAEGRLIKKKFFEECPALEKLIKGVKRAAGRGYLIGLDGGLLRIRRGQDGRLQRNKALNVLLQGAGAIVMKKSMVLMDDWVTELGLDAKKVIDMHDEAQWEVADKDVEKFMELAPQSIVIAGEHFNLNIPLAAEAKCGNNWSETH